MAKTQTVTPAYVSYRTFVNFLRRLKETGIGLPTRIDRDVLNNMSGSNQSALLGALEFLALIDSASTGHVTGRLKDLVGVVDDKDGWETAVSRLFDKAYEPILGSMDLGSATGNMLREAFKERGGLDGHTAVKAIGFCLKLAKEAGLTVSPYIRVSLPRASKPTKKAAKKKGEKKGDPGDKAVKEDSGKVRPPKGLMSITVTYPGVGEGSIQVPESFTAAHVDYIAAVLRGYVELQED